MPELSDLALNAALLERVEKVAVNALYAAREGDKVMDEAAKLTAAAVLAETIPAIREQLLQERREKGRRRVEVREADWVAEQPLGECWVSEDDHLYEVDSAVEEERKRVLAEIRSLAPHEVPCECPARGIAALDQHAAECPRGVVHHMLEAIEKRGPSDA